MSAQQNNPLGGADEQKQLRLTLRTLLAYLDDVLEPEQAREIGSRIQESQYASQLEERIREVLRRRRVAAPELSGPGSGLDPNIVAEYLDNTLPAKSVPDVERVCLESDSHLAEVAACHQILTLVLGDPITVGPQTRERLHALIPEGLSRQSASAEAPAKETAKPGRADSDSRQAAARVATSEARPTNGKTGPFSVPAFLKPKPFLRRAIVPALVVTVLLFWLALLVYDPSLLGDGSGDNQVAQTDSKETGESPESNSGALAKSGEADEAQNEEPVPNPPDNQPDVNQKNKTAPNIPIDEPPPMDMQEENANGEQLASNASANKTAPMNPETVEPAVAVNPDENAKTETMETTEKPVANAIDSRSVWYTVEEANSVTKPMLLRFDEEDKEWGILLQRTYVVLGEPLACPEPLDAVFSVRKTDCKITFIGGVLASFQAPESGAAFDLNLKQGKVIFERSEGGEDGVIFTVHVGEDILLFELMQPGTRFGLEILPKLPNQFEQGLGPNWYTGKLWVDSGQVRFMDRKQTAHTLGAKQALEITPQEVPEGQPQPPPHTAEADQILPGWLAPEGRKFKSLSAHYMRQLYAAFNEADVEVDVTTVLLPLAKDEKTPPPVAEMAAKTLAMTGVMRDVAALLALSEATPEEIRLAAIDSTRRWLTLHPGAEHGEKLLTELKRNFLEETANQIYRLLWGYRKSDLRDDSTEALKLVDQLNHNNITVRTLAFQILYELTGRTNNYRPLDTESQRRPAIMRWRDDVADGKIFN